MDEDLTGNYKVLILNFVLKITKLLILLASVSFFFAMSFKILIELQRDIGDWDDHGKTDQ